MNIKFTKVILHNFMSFGDAEVDLANRNYCLVRGINKNPADLAISNGSGKSTLFSAICWALTGETIQGLKSNVANIIIDQGCWVDVEFYIDGTKYEVKRYKDDPRYKTDLKLYVDDQDVSGKGIRESEQALRNYIPDLTSELIASVIILGQGLPHKFSNNTPSGRKDLLEKLSKSDFMIEDIKNRINARNTELDNIFRKYTDALLVAETKVESNNKLLEKYKIELVEVEAQTDIDDIINQVSDSKAKNEIIEKELSSTLNNANEELDKANAALLNINNKKSEEKLTLNENYNNNKTAINGKISEVNASITYLEKDIREKESIKDVCPTCGRPFEGVVKPDTTLLKEELKDKNETKANLQKVSRDMDADYREDTANLNNRYQEKLDDANHNVNMKQAVVNETRRKLDDVRSTLRNIESQLAKAEADKANRDKRIKDLSQSINDTEQTLKDLDADILYNNKERDNTQAHLDVIKQMNTLVRRDFRGFLLANIIQFIDAKAKEYCSDVFATTDLNFVLDGNNIDITYCGKAFENLSGGEKQKVDLILQFALRDMMCQYLDFSSNILCLDEIFDNLDSIGCDKVMQLISNKLTDVESLFIISHHADELNVPYDEEIIIEKNDKGISKIK